MAQRQVPTWRVAAGRIIRATLLLTLSVWSMDSYQHSSGVWAAWNGLFAILWGIGALTHLEALMSMFDGIGSKEDTE